MLSDQELGEVQGLIEERNSYITRIRGIAETRDPTTRSQSLTALYTNLRTVEHQLEGLGVIITPYEPAKGNQK